MARTRSGNYEDIQRGILSKAAALYSERGYIRSSIADLAEACQLSRGALYHYFDSKESILFAILDAHLRQMIDGIEAAVAKAESPRDQFRAAISKIVEMNAASLYEQRVLLNDRTFLGSDDRQKIDDLGRKIVDIVADLLTKLDTRGPMKAPAKKVYTMMIFGIINYTYTWYDPKGPVSPATFADMAVELFLGGFADREVRSASPRRREIA